MLGKQIQAARALLGWSQQDLSVAAGVSIPTIKRAEGSGKVKASESAIDAIVRSLSEAGIVFIFENGQGVGVRLVRISNE